MIEAITPLAWGVNAPRTIGFNVYITDAKESAELHFNASLRLEEDVDPRLVEFAKKYDYEVDIWPRAWLQVVIPREFGEWLERHNIDVEHFLDHVFGKKSDEDNFYTYRVCYRDEGGITYQNTWEQDISLNIETKHIDVILSREIEAWDDTELLKEVDVELKRLLERLKRYLLLYAGVFPEVRV